jgi:serine protease Do
MRDSFTTRSSAPLGLNNLYNIVERFYKNTTIEFMNSFNSFHKSRAGNRLITAGLFVAGILIFGGLISETFASVSHGAVSQANVFDSFLNLFKNGPGATSAASQAVPSSPVPLYKPVIDYEQAVVAAVKKASPAVVAITISKNVPILENCPTGPFSDLPPEFQQFFGTQGGAAQFYSQCQTGGTKLQEVGGGSGFIITSDGLIVTNKHVVSDVSASYAVFTNDGKNYPAKVLARDPVQDLAVIKIDAANLPTVELGDSDSVQLGQTAIAIGNALGEYRNTVSVGVISGLARTVTASGGDTTETIQGVLQTDAAINPGNSGGPLLNLQGQVIGINTAVASDAQNIGFAMPINRARRDIQSVKTTGTIEAPYLGVRYVMLTPDIATAKKLSISSGALVSAGGGSSSGGQGNGTDPAVAPNSPASIAGIQADDVIVQVNNITLDADHQLGSVISELQVGQTVAIKLNRKGQEMTVSVTLEKRPGG